MVRIEKSIELLHSDEDYTVTEVASLCGYCSIRHFNRVFLEETGYSPRSMPANFKLEIKQLKTLKSPFDPTLKESVLVG